MSWDQATVDALPATRVRPPSHRRGPTRGRTVRLAGPLLAAVFGLGLVISLLLWWRDTPGLHDVAGELTAAGRLTGLAGGYLLFVQMLLMSRVRVLERAVGSHNLASWHRDLGVLTFALLTGHAVFVTLGYARTDHTSVPGEVLSFVHTLPDMLKALLGYGLLVVIALTSWRWVRRRLSYEAWYHVHLVGYLALVLSFGHQTSDGQEFATHRGAHLLWTALLAGTLLCLAYGRLGAPLWLNLRHRLKVAHVVTEAPGVVSVYVAGHRLNELNVRAGQFFRWRFLTRGGWWQAHPFSISAAPNARWLRITVKALGDHTADLQRLRPGVRVFAEGPYGAFVTDARTQDKVLLVGGGIGITPIRALLEELPPGEGRAVVIYRAGKAEDLVFRTELDQLAATRGARVIYLLGGPTDPAAREALSPRGLRRLVPDLGERDVYLCGPPGLVQAVHATLRRLRVPRRRIHLDPFEF